MRTEITREIGIDAGHRVTNHASKCRNLHGHRYRIQATLNGMLCPSGSEEGMVMDFGFLKELMMQYIHDNCDHAFMVWNEDPLLRHLYTGVSHEVMSAALSKVVSAGGVKLLTPDAGVLYIVPFVPTAENLARHWFRLLANPVAVRSEFRAQLIRIRVWETPNSFADCACE